MSDDETIRTSLQRIIADPTSPNGVRQLACEILMWIMRHRASRPSDRDEGSEDISH